MFKKYKLSIKYIIRAINCNFDIFFHEKYILFKFITDICRNSLLPARYAAKPVRVCVKMKDIM